ncbi:hypothetical protein K438DRAFT_1798724 [Mycena galopus ATCC 62051]|nr:hypothetical protein K438DRAFT_1798724 [Mycena galopus ATCC 62051]
MKAPIPLAVLVGLSITAHAICPGFDFAIGNVIPLSEHVNRWNVYDDSCSVIDGLSLNSTGNPCNQRIFGCSPAPILFDQYTNTATGSTYACQRDPNSDVCGSDNISVCVSAILAAIPAIIIESLMQLSQQTLVHPPPPALQPRVFPPRSPPLLPRLVPPLWFLHLVPPLCPATRLTQWASLPEELWPAWWLSPF